MAIDLMKLEPQRISRNLKGKFLLIYGREGCGKTTLATQFPKPLIVSFEQGTNGLDNVYVAPMKTWNDWRQIGSQLCRKAELKDKFETVCIDTVDSAWDLCVKFVCGQHGVDKIGDVPYGQGYDIAKKEFSTLFRDLTFAGFGLLFISHSTEKMVKDKDGNEFAQINPALAKKPYEIINKLVDITGYIDTELTGDDKGKRFIYFRQTDRFFAKSRFRGIAPRVDFSYKNIEKALLDAIDKTVLENGGEATTDENPYTQLDYEALMEEAKMLWGRIIQEDKIEVVNKILTEEFGKPIKFSEIPEENINELNHVILKIKDIL